MLGSSYNNNKDANKKFTPTVYSAYGMKNIKSDVDKTLLGASFWKGLIKLYIAPLKGEDFIPDNENEIAIYLNHTKAAILANEIILFMSNPKEYNSCGIPSGKGLITICNGLDFGKTVNDAFMVIRKINEENGKVEASYAYEFKSDYHYSIRNYDEKTNQFDRNTTDYIKYEIESLVTLLTEYSKAMTNAVAYTVLEQFNFENSRVNFKLEAIAEAVGAQIKKSGSSGGGSSKSFFNKQQEGAKPNGGGFKANTYSNIEIDDIG